MNDKIKKLKKMIDESNYIVFFGGAGVSTESGIPDFRSPDGLYNEKYKYPPEEILSHYFLINNSSEFYKFYREKMDSRKYKPNITHTYLAKLEKSGKLKAVITQNIDNLHQRAGSKNVIELHGSIYKNYCIKCGKTFDENIIFNSKGIPYCQCGGMIRPEVTLYGEELDTNSVSEAIYHISKADMLIIGGTSLTVYPACSYINFFNGKYKVLINNSATSFDENVDLLINSKLGDVFKCL